MNADVKITVLKKSFNQEFVDEYTTGEWTPCSRLKSGREFICRGLHMPEGFCSWAWADIMGCVMTLARGGNFLGTKPGIFVTNCTDGFRPVSFKLERMET